MKHFYIIIFLFFSTFSFSQTIKVTILDSETKKPIEKAHVFFINETIYSNKKGEFSFNLKGLKKITFTISHIKYNSQKVVYKNNNKSNIIYLKEKLEILDGINISANKDFKLAISFTKLKSLPKAVYSFASIINENRIYVFGGDESSKYDKNKEGLSQVQFSNEAEILKFLTMPKPISFNNYIGDIQTYNISEKKWNIEENKVINRAHYNAILYNDTVFLIGGKQFSKKKTRELLADQIELVSLKDLSIKKDKTNPHQAVDFGTALYDDKILVFGGSLKQFENGKVKFSNDVHFYDLKTGYWYLLTKMPKAKEVTGIVFDDRLYFFGGYNKKNLTEIESFNLKTGRWKKEGNLFSSMKKPAITKDNEFIYLLENGKIITYEIKTKTIKEYIIDLNLNASEMHYYNETLFIVGGYYVEDYRKAPSNGLYKIEVSEFFRTKPNNVKTLINVE